jgi:replicative DNA helicase
MTEPYNLEAEQSIIGGLLIDPGDTLPKIIDKIAPNDFYNTVHGEFFGLLCEMAGSGRKIDAVSAFEYFKGKIALSDKEIKQELFICADILPSLANFQAYVDIVAKNARARRFQRVINEAMSVPISADTVDEAAERLMSGIYESSQQNKRGGLQTFHTAVFKYYENLFRKDRQNRIDTGFGDLDAILKGLCGGNLILLAARPGVGKSAFATTIAKNVAAKSGKSVAIFSCEMESDELVERVMADESCVDMDQLIDSESLINYQEKIDSIAQASDRLMKLPIYISDDANVTTAGIRAQCRMVRNLGLIVVDYLQLLRSTRKSESRNAEVGMLERVL